MNWRCFSQASEFNLFLFFDTQAESDEVTLFQDKKKDSTSKRQKRQDLFKWKESCRRKNDGTEDSADPNRGDHPFSRDEWRELLPRLQGELQR